MGPARGLALERNLIDITKIERGDDTRPTVRPRVPARRARWLTRQVS
jgi:hypothetical protein